MILDSKLHIVIIVLAIHVKHWDELMPGFLLNTDVHSLNGTKRTLKQLVFLTACLDYHVCNSSILFYFAIISIFFVD